MAENRHAAGDTFDWELQGLCRTQPETFFPNHANESPKLAKAICRRCPVQTTCLDWALREREPYGIWGGLTTRERRRLLRLRARE